MKHPLIFLILLVCMLAGPGTASARTVQQKQHKRWNSFIIVQEQSIARASSWDARRQVLLTCDFYPETCRLDSLQLIQEAEGLADRNIQAAGLLRIDTRPVMPVTLDIEVTDGVLFVTLRDVDMRTLLYDAVLGSTLRIKIPGKQKDIYLRYSLMGFTDACTRAQRLCGTLRRQEYDPRNPGKNPDADFFREPHGKGAVPENDPDTAYF